jgi:predicted TPR repeat methyltransferase
MVASLETDAVIDPVRASFDRVAEQYAADFADELTRKPWDVERLRRFAATCGPGPVLDVGCGSAGHVGRFVADLGARVVGVDFSERSVAHASGLNPTLRATRGPCPSPRGRAPASSRSTR